MSPAPNDFNQTMIETFRATGGHLGGGMEDAPAVLLHTTGARSGKERVNPVVYLADGDRVVVFASKAGAPSDPDWYRNLQANPTVTIEIGTETRTCTARTATGDERERLWARQKDVMPGFVEYEASTDRQIPVVILESA